MSVLLSCILGICSFHLNLDDVFSYHCSSCIRFHGVGGTHNLTLLSAPQFLCYFGPYCSYVLVHASFLHICISVGSTPRNRLAWSLQYHHLKFFNWLGHTSFHWDCPQLTFPTATPEMPIFPLLHQTRDAINHFHFANLGGGAEWCSVLISMSPYFLFFIFIYSFIWAVLCLSCSMWT